MCGLAGPHGRIMRSLLGQGAGPATAAGSECDHRRAPTCSQLPLAAAAPDGRLTARLHALPSTPLHRAAQHDPAGDDGWALGRGARAPTPSASKHNRPDYRIDFTLTSPGTGEDTGVGGERHGRRSKRVTVPAATRTPGRAAQRSAAGHGTSLRRGNKERYCAMDDRATPLRRGPRRPKGRPSRPFRTWVGRCRSFMRTCALDGRPWLEKRSAT